MSPRTTAPRVRVAIVGGGQNCEHEVSLASAASVRNALDPSSYEILALTVERDGIWLDAEGAPLGTTPAESLAAALLLLRGCDVVFPAMHGPLGEDGALAALCALAGIPCVGSPLRAGALAMDKWATKLVAEAIGIATVSGVLISAHQRDRLRFDGPVVVKPVAAGSSHGVRLVTDEGDLDAAVTAALELDDRILVERAIVGREIDIAVLTLPGDRRILGPPLEVVMDPGTFFDTDSKYDGSAKFLIPAPLTAVELEQLEAAALGLYEALGCAGVARIDFFLTADGLMLNEVNTMPGMTQTSQVPLMFAAAGLSYPELLDALVRGALT